jgi:hypothetical protein
MGSANDGTLRPRVGQPMLLCPRSGQKIGDALSPQARHYHRRSLAGSLPVRSVTRDPFKQRAGEPLSVTETFIWRVAGTSSVAHAVDNDQQLVSDELALQMQHAFRMRPRRPSRLDEALLMIAAAAFLSGHPYHRVHALPCRKKATMQPNFLHTVAGETAPVEVRDRYVRVTCAHTPLRAACSQ